MGWFRRKVSRSCQPGGGVGLSLTGCQPDSNWIDLRCGDSCNEAESTHLVESTVSRQARPLIRQALTTAVQRCVFTKTSIFGGRSRSK